MGYKIKTAWGILRIADGLLKITDTGHLVGWGPLCVMILQLDYYCSFQRRGVRNLKPALKKGPDISH